MTRTRDPDDKKRRLVNAALAEFAEHGPDAARVDSIAHRAGVNKQLIYHYFGSKAGLWHHVLVAFSDRFDEAAAEPPEPLDERLARYFEQTNNDRDFTRLLEWEALTVDPDNLANAEPRREQLLAFARELAGDIDSGRLPDDCDPKQLALTIIATASFARAFPQFVQLLTGTEPDDPAFIDARRRHHTWLGRQLTTIPEP